MAAAGVEEIDTCPPAGFARELARANRSWREPDSEDEPQQLGTLAPWPDAGDYTWRNTHQTRQTPAPSHQTGNDHL